MLLCDGHVDMPAVLSSIYLLPVTGSCTIGEGGAVRLAEGTLPRTACQSHTFVC